MPRPTFLIPGASKAGTSSLHYYLNEHPDIHMSNPKELRFFDREKNHRKGLTYYESQFEPAEEIAETSPPYWYHGITFDTNGDYRWDDTDDVPRRVAESYPDMKLVFTIRNPVDRSYSQYWKNVCAGWEDAPTYRQALEQELAGERRKEDSPTCWIYKNDIPTHLERWLQFYERSEMKIIVFEEWIEDPETTLNETCEFLGVATRETWDRKTEEKNPSVSPRSRRLTHFFRSHLDYSGLRKLHHKLNLQQGYPDMDNETHEFVYDVFDSVIVDTEALLNRKLPVWRP